MDKYFLGLIFDQEKILAIPKEVVKECLDNSFFEYVILDEEGVVLFSSSDSELENKISQVFMIDFDYAVSPENVLSELKSDGCRIYTIDEVVDPIVLVSDDFVFVENIDEGCFSFYCQDGRYINEDSGIEEIIQDFIYNLLLEKYTMEYPDFSFEIDPALTYMPDGSVKIKLNIILYYNQHAARKRNKVPDGLNRIIVRSNFVE